MKYVFKSVGALISHITQSYDWDELSPLKLQCGLYLSYAYYTKYYNIIRVNEKNTPPELFEVNFIADDNGIIVDGLSELFQNEDSYERDVNSLLKDNIKDLYLVDERILKNVDNIMMEIVDMSNEELVARVSSDDSWQQAYNNAVDKSVDLNHVADEYRCKDEFSLITEKETFNYNSIL